MRFYRQASENIAFIIKRCYFEAEQSRVKLALDRIAELNSQFTENAKILYNEGVIRRDYLGQGLLARDLFERAYTLALQSQVQGDYCWSAASNAAGLAGNETEFRKWAALTATAPPIGAGLRPSFQSFFQDLDTGTPYLEILLRAAEVMHEAGHQGSSAAHMEVALATGSMDRSTEAFRRRLRAQALRDLDDGDEKIRTATCEDFPACERVALHEAVMELDRALALDPYDCELWNLRAAWQNILGNFSEALDAADKAAQLRDPYPKAHINAATAMYRQQRYDQARSRISLALQQARELGDLPDIEQAQQLASAYAAPPTDPTLEELVPEFETVLQAARRCSTLEMERVHGDIQLADVVGRLIGHANVARGQMAMGFVPMIAEMLSDFTPETVCNVIINAKQRAPQMMGDWLCAALYLAANCDGVERRDASRLVTLLLFIPLDARRIRDNYRYFVLAPSSVLNGPLSRLASAMQDAIKCIHPALCRLMADQAPIGEAERRRAKTDILSKLAGSVPAPNPNFSSERRPGCLAWLFGQR